MEEVDVLVPPLFKKCGTKPRKQAIKDKDWIGAFNLWVVQDDPEPAILYQQRSENSTWEPNKLDVAAGGNYSVGESMVDGLREAEEELGKKYSPSKLTSVGRRLNVSPDINGHYRYSVLDICIITDNSSLETFSLEENEVSALFVLPISQLQQMYSDNQSFQAQGIDVQGNKTGLIVSKSSFPKNWDNYHFKMFELIKRYITDEKNLIY